MKRQATRGKQDQAQPQILKDPITTRTAPRPAFEDSQTDQDPDCMEIDMLDEARYRVYFGFFHLDWLDSAHRTGRHRSDLKLGTFAGSGGQKGGRHRELDLSGAEPGTKVGVRRPRDASADRSLRSCQSARHQAFKDATLRTEPSPGRDLPHVCSLYGRPLPLAEPFRDDKSKPCSPGYNTLRSKRQGLIDDLDADCERLKVFYNN